MFDGRFRYQVSSRSLRLRRDDERITLAVAEIDVAAIVDEIGRRCQEYGLPVERAVICRALLAHLQDVAARRGGSRLSALSCLAADFPAVLADALTGTVRC